MEKPLPDLDHLANAMRNLDLDVEVLPESNACRSLIRDDDGDLVMACVAWVHPDAGYLCATAMLPQPLPDESMPRVREFVLRANHVLSTGFFDLDLSDNTIRFKVGLVYRDAGLTEALAQAALLECLGSMEVYIDPLTNVVTGASTPAEAIEEL